MVSFSRILATAWALASAGYVAAKSPQVNINVHGQMPPSVMMANQPMYAQQAVHPVNPYPYPVQPGYAYQNNEGGITHHNGTHTIKTDAHGWKQVSSQHEPPQMAPVVNQAPATQFKSMYAPYHLPPVNVPVAQPAPVYQAPMMAQPMYAAPAPMPMVAPVQPMPYHPVQQPQMMMQVDPMALLQQKIAEKTTKQLFKSMDIDFPGGQSGQQPVADLGDLPFKQVIRSLKNLKDNHVDAVLGASRDPRIESIHENMDTMQQQMNNIAGYLRDAQAAEVASAKKKKTTTAAKATTTTREPR